MVFNGNRFWASLIVFVILIESKPSLCYCEVESQSSFYDDTKQGSSETYEADYSHVKYAVRDGTVQSKGVNIGGWLVAEHWMTSQADIWKGVSPNAVDHGEYQALTNFTDTNDSSSLHDQSLTQFDWHHKNFITEKEIKNIHEAGFNTVRVPVGYWIVGFDEHDKSGSGQWKKYPSNELVYLDTLIKSWAKTHNVSVMISMHAAKGSQSGAEHSSPEMYGQALFGQYPENIQSTLDAVTFLAARYKDEDAFLGIGLLNEPSGSTTNQVLYQYYQAAYDAIRVNGGNDCILTVAPLLWEQGPKHLLDLLPGSTNVWVEWHRYFIWGYGDDSANKILTEAIDAFRKDAEKWNELSDKKLYIGEFSFANTGQFTDVEGLRKFAAQQMDVLKNIVEGGWAYWSWRTYGDEEGLSPWSCRNMIRNGIFQV